MMSIKKYLLIIVIMLGLEVNAQSNQVYFKAASPGMVPHDSTFEVSLISNINFSDFEKINFYLLTESGIELKKVLVRNKFLSKPTQFKNVNYLNHTGKSYRIQFNACNEDTFYQSPIQIILKLKANYLDETELAFASEYFKNSKIEKSSSSFEGNSAQNSFPVIPIKFYRPQKLSGESLLLLRDGIYQFPIDKIDFQENLAIEFWAKIKKGTGDFFRIIHGENKDTLFRIGQNRFQMVKIPQNFAGKLYHDFYLGNGNWHHFLVNINKNSRTCYLWIDGIQILESEFNSSFMFNQKLYAEFSSGDMRNSLEIDQLKIWDLNNSPKRIFENLNFNITSLDSSLLLAYHTFDISEVNKINSDETDELILISNFELVKSSIPVFSQLPEVSVSNYDVFREITWFNHDDNQVNYYELQKSVDGKNYVMIFSRVSDSDPQKKYSYLDHKGELEDVVYYRIRQINKDGSILYSPTIKIGVGLTEKFTVDQNYPNPFNPKTSITVEVLESSYFDINVYDLVGNKVQQLFNGTLAHGSITFEFDGSKLPSGIYFLDVTSKSSSKVVKMILAK